MTYQFDGYNYLIRLNRGEELIEKLIALAKEKDIKGAWLGGLGGAESAVLGFYDLEAKTYVWQHFDVLTEITSLQGNLAWMDDKPVWHIHATLSGNDFGAVGGHVKELIVGGACEIFLHSRFGGEKLTRSNDGATGLNLLDL